MLRRCGPARRAVAAAVVLGVCGAVDTCADWPLPDNAPALDCADAKGRGMCETSINAARFCPKTCDLCTANDTKDHCSYDGKDFNHGFHGCYDECHKDCDGSKWLCWHGQWHQKGPCGPGNGDVCVGDDGKVFTDGHHACFDQCYPRCDGNKWICVHGDWVPKGRCTWAPVEVVGAPDVPIAYDPAHDCIGDDGQVFQDGFHVCFDACYEACDGQAWVCVGGKWESQGQCAHVEAEEVYDTYYEWSVFRNAMYTRVGNVPVSRLKDACAVVHAFPVIIMDEAENNFVRQLCGVHGPCWIGLVKSPDPGVWAWMDGTTATYLNWQEGQPETGIYWGGETENFAIMNHPPGSSRGTWYAAPSKWDKPVALCKRFHVSLTDAAGARAGGRRAAPARVLASAAALAAAVGTCAYFWRKTKSPRQPTLMEAGAREEDDVGEE